MAKKLDRIVNCPRCYWVNEPEANKTWHDYGLCAGCGLNLMTNEDIFSSMGITDKALAIWSEKIKKIAPDSIISIHCDSTDSHPGGIVTLNFYYGTIIDYVSGFNCGYSGEGPSGLVKFICSIQHEVYSDILARVKEKNIFEYRNTRVSDRYDHEEARVFLKRITGIQP